MEEITRVDLARPAGFAAGLLRDGFVAVHGHGLESARIARVEAHFARFFARPEQEKRRCVAAPGGARGYTPFGLEQAVGHPRPDLKEFFHVGPAEGRYPENVWPSGLPGLRADTEALFEGLAATAATLLEALAKALGLSGSPFAEMVREGNHVLRALHYPPVAPGVDPGSLRAAPHEDINLITLLCGGSEAGLEIRDAGGAWRPVVFPPDHLIVDSGDMLSRVTNGRVPATTHRVVNPPGASNRPRYAIVFFAHPRPECDLRVLDAFTGPGDPPRTPPILAGNFLAERLREIGLQSL